MATHNQNTLPPDFLCQPAPDLNARRIDFSQTEVPHFANCYAVLVDDALSPAECSSLVAAAEASTSAGWERAMVNIGGGRQAMHDDIRRCGRIIWDSPEVVALIWNRIGHLPEVQEIARLQNVPNIVGNGPGKRNEVWKFTRPNERMRFLKYVGGEYFRPHCDGTYETPDRKERSYFTMHLYLNDSHSPGADASQKQQPAEESALVGGATTFFSGNLKKQYDVMPKAGRILLFQHRGLLHSGEEVLAGTKYTLRTDLMYALEGSVSADED